MVVVWWIWLIFVPLHDSCWVWYWAITEYFYLKCYQCFFVVMMLGDTPDRGGGGSVSDCEIPVEISSCHTVLSYWSPHNELTGQTGDIIYGSY